MQSQFCPPGFERRAIATALGSLVYTTAIPAWWHQGLAEAAALPSLIFLHSVGGGSSAYEWSKVFPAFAATHQIIAPDLIGWGASEHPARDYQMADYWQMLTELIQQLTQPPVIVVASSLTAGMTIRLAIQQPELFQGLFLICPTGFADFGLDYGGGLSAQLAGTPGLDRLIYLLGAANEVAVRTFLEQVLFARSDRLMPETVQAYLDSATQPNAEFAALASLRGDLCFDLALFMEQLRVPTVILWGEKSRFTSATVGRRLAQLNPEAVRVFQTIPAVGVLPHLELPELVIGLMQRYLPWLH